MTDVQTDIQSAPRKDPYLKHEWQEPLHIREYLHRRLTTIPIEITKTKTLVETSQKNDEAIEPSPVIPKHLISGSIVLKDSNGEIFLVKISTGINEVFETARYREKEPPMHTYIQQAWDRLYNRGIRAPPPEGEDQRYPRSQYNVAKRYWESKGVAP